MLLAVDIGNTQTVLGLFAEEGSGAGEVAGSNGLLRHHWRIATNSERTADEHALLVTELMSLESLNSAEAVTGIVVSSTVPRLTATLREMASRWYDVPTVVLEPGIKTGVHILYDDPREVGADRIANAVGAFCTYGGPAVVVDYGTATTFDVISDAGEYMGGLIVPGIDISMDALFRQAAALGRVEFLEPRRVIGKNTVESIQAGAIYGFSAQTEGICRKIESEIGKATIILTGGLAEVIAPHIEMPFVHDPWLTLEGLRIVFGRNT